jgi:hypothetical protein
LNHAEESSSLKPRRSTNSLRLKNSDGPEKLVDVKNEVWFAHQHTRKDRKSMNSKTLLLLGAIGAVAMASAEAQVYSVNAVGYVNKTLKPGFNLIANPLNAANNTLAGILPAPAEGTTVYKWTGSTYAISAFEFGAWSDATVSLAPGEGAFVTNPTASDVTVTFVGDVLTGALSNPIPAGFSMRSSQVPQAGGLTSVLGLPATDGTVVYQFNATTQTYALDSVEFGAWGNSGAAGPSLAVGEAVWISAPAATTWTRTFSVN